MQAAFDIMAEEEARFRGTPFVKTDEPLEESAHLTVAEVIVALDPTADDPLSQALDEAIEHVREFQLHYHLETQVWLRRLTRQSLPQLIPVLRRSADGSSTPSTTMMLVHEGGPDAAAAAVVEVSHERLNRLLGRSTHGPADIFRTFVEMRQEAHISRLSCNYAAASLFCGIAAEALLTELVLMLFWEEDKPLHEVAELFGSRDNISKELLSSIAHRLRGDWDRNGNGPLGRWQRNVADLRNRVAHLGASPSEEEVQAAFASVQALEGYVGDRLLEGRNFVRYSQTVRTYLNEDGIARRNRAKAWSKFASGNEIFPAHATSLFTLWKNEVDRIRYGTSAPSLERSVVVLVAYPNGAQRWYLVDEEVDLACEIAEPILDSITQETLERNMSFDDWDVVSCMVYPTKTTPPVSPEWRPSYHFLPLKSIHRWNQCLWRPPVDHPSLD
ncbi:hypothetical protein GCM10009636_03870 [Arthrobacter koreensis]|uniref:hypothetical protein n=1 Tax=Arthrobacter koreensis TaxID=199136 RepID=UPI00186AF2E3|nr:hypothetical protein [Arthrobacter koreensis]